METHFEDLALTVRAGNLQVPYDLADECLFLSVRAEVIELLGDSRTQIIYFGPAPDNTADGIDELLEDGVFYRITAYQKNLGIDLKSDAQAILGAFHHLVENFEPRFTTVFLEQGMEKKEITIELLYQQVF